MKVPLYLIVGDKPVSVERTEDGGMALRGWDFARREMTREAASWDDVVAIDSPDPVREQAAFSAGDTRVVTKLEFLGQIERLKRRPR